MATLARDPETVLRHAFTPIYSAPAFCGDVSVTTAVAILVADLAQPNRNGTRRFSITNMSSTETLGICFADLSNSGTFPAGITGCKKVPPLTTYEVLVGTNMSVGAVGTNTLTASVLVHDVT